MLTAVIFLVVISVLVFVHEVGHFVAAKRAGMRVQEFGFGFPPRLWGVRRGETVYSLNWIPFGGFVKIHGEDGQDRSSPFSFAAASFGRKVGVVVAGVVMNFLFAAALLVLGNFLGLRVGLFEPALINLATDKQVQIISVSPDSPAAAAGLMPLDAITGFRLSDGSLLRVTGPEQVQEFSLANAGREVTIILSRGGEELALPLALREPVGPTEGPIGISLVMTGVVSYPWYQALWRGVADAGMMFISIVVGYAGIIGSLFTDGRLAGEVAGPVGIATLTGQAARIGFNYLVQFVAVISMNLAVLNILPFPALDGGRLAILIGEKVRGRPLRQHTERLINGLGFLFLLGLMVAVTIKDIGKLF
ncbi:MAG TPA: site-2 protease family protein [Candidatus Paceibacterota bacterium]|nr:site-2 protease family protein [Candidatus Paceibacterota bacterium]